jgi:hypothetical protein
MLAPLLAAALALSGVEGQDKSSEQILAEAEALMSEAKALYESGKTKGVFNELMDAGFKADEARVKYQAVQQITSGENQKKAASGAREANQLVKMVNDARVALKRPGVAPPPPADPTKPPPPPPPPPPPMEKKAPPPPGIDLLKHVSAEKDILSGRWMVQPGKLLLLEKRAKGTPLPRVEIPYAPPEDYDLRVSFRHSGNGEIYIQLSYGGQPFAFEMGGESNSVFALRTVKEPPGDPTTTVVRKAKCLEGARIYTALIEVRKDAVKAYLDDLLIAYSAVTKPGDLSVPLELAPRRPELLGLAAGHQAVFTAVEIVEIKGKGKPVR